MGAFLNFYIQLFRSDTKGKGVGAGRKDEKGKKNSQRGVEVLKKTDAATSGTGRKSAAATIVAPAAASTPKPSAESGPGLQPKPAVVLTESSASSLAPASGKAAATADTTIKSVTEEVVSITSASSQFVSPATGLVVARVRHAVSGLAISVQERGQLARCVIIKSIFWKV